MTCRSGWPLTIAPSSATKASGEVRPLSASRSWYVGLTTNRWRRRNEVGGDRSIVSSGMSRLHRIQSRISIEQFDCRVVDVVGLKVAHAAMIGRADTLLTRSARHPNLHLRF